MKTYKKNFIAVFAVILVMVLLLPSAVLAEFPKHQNYIADEAGILTEDVIRELRDINKNLAGDYGLTIAVCTVNTIGDSDIAEYARQLYSSWKLGKGVLVLIAKDDNNYYFVPSADMEDILTNEVLASVRDSYFEEDFSSHTYERAVHKIAIKLKSILLAGMQERAAKEEAEANRAAEESAAAAETEEKGTTVGSVIVGFFKVILWLVILAVILFIAVFVWAMFNEDVAAILQKLFFRRNAANRQKTQQNYYDDRLYGNRTNPNPQQRPGNAQRRPMPNGYLGDGRNQGGYPQNGGYPAQGQYQQYQQQPMNSRGAYPQQNGGYPMQGQYQQYPHQPMNNRGGYPQQNGGYPAQGQYQQYPQQPVNPQYPQQNYGQQTGYSGGQQGYPQQNPANRYGNPAYGQVPQQNRAPMQNGDATVQFNIPRR